MNATANFNRIPTDDTKFAALAPKLSSDPCIIQLWGVVNIAQCAQQDGEREGCWCLDYLQEAFAGNCGGLLREELAEVRALWVAAGGSPEDRGQ